MKLFLKLKYDGTNYAGYQVQNNAPTIQAELNKSLYDLFGCECDVTGCSRTDSGVHAECFCATVQFKDSSHFETQIPCERIPLALNFRLPEDISVFYADFVEDDFHARYSVVSKTYEYKIWNSYFRNPFLKNKAYHLSKPICEDGLKNMMKATKYFCGLHDFAAFMSAGSSVKSTERTVYNCEVLADGDEITIRISADGFLYNMVRIICGTLLKVGKGSLLPEQISDIILSKNRHSAGPTLPACGLYLIDVKYPE